MIRLDFARTVSRPVQLLRWGVFAAGVAAAASILVRADGLQDRLVALEWKQDTALVVTRSPGALRADGTAAGLSPQLRDVLKELDVDWRGVFEAIEQSVAPGIRIMAIRPDPQKQTLLIQAKAANGVQAQRFVERLQGGGTISDAHLVHEARDDDNELVDFSVRARWESKP